MNTSASPFLRFLAEKPLVIFTGPTGTELQRRGYNTALPLWSAQANLDVPNLLTEIHSDYLRAGADIIVTNTFRTTPRTYAKVGREQDARPSMNAAVDAARAAQKAVDRPTFVAGSFATLEDCYYLDRVPDDAALEREHTQLAEWLAEEKVDFLLPETIGAVREAKAMAKAASATGLPFMITVMSDGKGCMLDGTPLAEAAKATDYPGRFAIGLNCRPIDTINHDLPMLPHKPDECICVYANGVGHPHDDLGWVFDESGDAQKKYIDAAIGWKKSGAKIIGGCCGTTPAYIRALSDALKAG